MYFFNYRINYVDSKGRDKFLEYFSITSWAELTPTEKSKHRYENCQACLHPPHGQMYRLLRRNSKVVIKESQAYDDIEYIIKTSTTAEGSFEIVKDRFNEHVEAKYGKPFEFPETATTPRTDGHISTADKSAIATSMMKAIAPQIVEPMNEAILGGDLSYKGISNLRRHLGLEQQTPKHKPKNIRPDIYDFDKEGVAASINGMAADGKVNWLELSRRHPVKLLCGKPALNGNQILKQYAIQEGLYQVDENCKPRERRSKRKLDVGDGVTISLADMLPTDQALKGVTREKIASGEWDIGTPIVPITLYLKKLNKEGDIERSSVTIHGRAFSLQKIMDSSLQDAENLGLLRKTYPVTYDIQKALKELEAVGECHVNNVCIPQHANNV